MRGAVATRRAIRQGGRSPTERSQRCWLAGEQDKQVDERSRYYAVDSADEKVTKCHVRGEVAVDVVNGANDN